MWGDGFMLKKLKNKLNKIISSQKGAGIYIIMFFMLPLMLLVVGTAIDISAYLAARTQLQNALDISSVAALNRSTLDQYRADKMIKVILDKNSNNSFYSNFKQLIEANLNTTAEYVSDDTLQFVPRLYITPYPSTVTIVVKKRTSSDYDNLYTGNETNTVQGNLADADGFTNTKYDSDCDIELELKTQVLLPVYRRIASFFNYFPDKKYFEIPITVKSSIRGVRIKSPNDFNEYQFEYNP